MHFLAFLFFAGLIGVSFALIRSMFADANDKIEAALAGEYDLKADRAAPPLCVVSPPEWKGQPPRRARLTLA
jgi:hypothetical protein